MKRAFVGVLVSLVLAIVLAGCCGGGGKETVVVAPESGTGGATAGQQLQDLKAAYDQGAITEEEYEKQKEKILKAE
ncbi:MAG: SHOCT domain-containing protein [Desulfuromonadales bacterium]